MWYEVRYHLLKKVSFIEIVKTTQNYTIDSYGKTSMKLCKWRGWANFQAVAISGEGGGKWIWRSEALLYLQRFIFKKKQKRIWQNINSY